MTTETARHGWTSFLYGAGEAVLSKSIKLAAQREIRRRINEPLRIALVNLWNEIKIARTTRSSAKYLQTLEGAQGLKIHLGCGPDIRTGWINIDLAPGRRSGVLPDIDPQTMFISYDLRLGLPLHENSCDMIYSSHFFEHLESRQGLQLMHDCYRALRHGGVFRIALPNLAAIFQAYLRRDHEYFDLLDMELPEVPPGTKAFIDYVNYGVYQEGQHKFIYDEEKLALTLKHIGFDSVVPSSYREGIDPDTAVRRHHSFYMEAAK